MTTLNSMMRSPSSSSSSDHRSRYISTSGEYEFARSATIHDHASAAANSLTSHDGDDASHSSSLDLTQLTDWTNGPIMSALKTSDSSSASSTPFESNDSLRPSPTLLAAMNGNNSQSISPGISRPQSIVRCVSHSPTTIRPMNIQLAGRIPPSLELEKPALESPSVTTITIADTPIPTPSPTTTNQTNGSGSLNHNHFTAPTTNPSLNALAPPSARSNGRIRSSSGADRISNPPNSTQIQRVNVTNSLTTRATRSMSDSNAMHPLQDEDETNEEGSLLHSQKRGLALRNRSHSSNASPSILPQSIMTEPIAWSSKTSRVLLVCASGILFMLLFIFCSVVGLRMAAKVKYDNSLCMARPRSSSSGNEADYTFGYTSKWVPNYSFDEWNREWFEEQAKKKFKKEATPTTTTTPTTSENSDADDPDMIARITKLWEAGSYLSSLRLNHFKFMGTHNSYHVASSLPLKMHHYTHASLPHQLATYRRGVRQLELDVHLIHGKGSLSATPTNTSTTNSSAVAPHPVIDPNSSDQPGLVVYHLQWLDDRTTCYCLSECLELVSRWSSFHPAHFPIFLTIEIKSQLWEDVDTGLRGVSCADVENIEREVLNIFPRDKLITPLEVRGGPDSEFKTVQAALNSYGKAEDEFRKQVKARIKASQPLPTLDEYSPKELAYGWPKLQSSLGKILVVWLDDTHNLADKLNCLANTPTTNTDTKDTSTAATATTPAPSNPNWHNDDSRVIFIAQNSLDKSYSSIITQNKPALATRAGTITHAISHGYLVRTMTDESADALPDRGRFRSALKSGASIISTDFEECIIRTEFHKDSEDDLLTANEGDRDDLDSSSDDIHEAIHASAASPSSSSSPVSSVLPIQIDLVTSNTTEVYCEHLASEWPFECNHLSAPFFCENALQAARIQMEFTDQEEQDN